MAIHVLCNRPEGNAATATQYSDFALDGGRLHPDSNRRDLPVGASDSGEGQVPGEFSHKALARPCRPGDGRWGRLFFG